MQTWETLLGRHPEPGRALREALAEPGPLVVPGAYDAASAVLVQSAGFRSVYMTGFGVAASVLGRPDIGLATMTEMVDAAHRMADVVDIPVIADADTGYGTELGIVRTVHEYERAGVAAIQIEDQVSPKRCGHMSGKAVVGVDEAVRRVRTAVEARRSPETLIVARTDAAQVDGIDAAIERAARFAEVGADILFVEAPEQSDDVREVAKRLSGTTLLFNHVEGGVGEPMTVDELGQLGFGIVLFPISTLLAAVGGARDVLRGLAEAGSTAPSAGRMAAFSEVTDLLRLPDLRNLENQLSRD